MNFNEYHVLNRRDQDVSDMRILLQAAAVLKRRSKKPNGWGLAVAVKVLRDTANRISQGKLPVLR